MRRADRQRERIGGVRLHNILAIPIYTNLHNANLIKQFSRQLKPPAALPLQDIDALRVAIATRKGKSLAPGKTKLMDPALSQWARINPGDTTGTFHCVGVIQVINGLVDMRKVVRLLGFATSWMRTKR